MHLTTSHLTDQELLAVVDENDTVIGMRARKEIHSLGLRHRAVHILVRNSRGEILLQKRSPHKDVNPGAWDTSAAGHVDYGEDYDVAALREVREELGIQSQKPLEPLGSLEATVETGWEFVRIYVLDHSGSIQINPEEIDAVEWHTAEAIESILSTNHRVVTQSFRRIWSLYLQTRQTQGQP